VSTNEMLKTRNSIIELQLKAIYCLPLSVKGKRIGVVYLDSWHLKPEPFERNVFEAIVSLCAVAIERARLYEENRQNNLLAAVGTIASSVVHDFKNALFLISGHTELLSSTCTDPQILFHLEQIQSSVERLSATSSGILDFARANPAEKPPVNLAEFLNKIIASWQIRAKEHNIIISGSGPDCVINLETSSFARVINNILSNSVDSLTDSNVEGHIQLLWESTPKEVTIQVIDNGIGIPKRVLARIFEPFYSYGKEKGTGLGMSTVKNIVEGHGGTVSVDSEVGRGTTVKIHVPHSGVIPEEEAKTRDLGELLGDA